MTIKMKMNKFLRYKPSNNLSAFKTSTAYVLSSKPLRIQLVYYLYVNIVNETQITWDKSKPEAFT